jgi:hypothetical protein
MLELELGEDEKISRCRCCGRESKTGHGFVYKDQQPFSVYYVGWSSAHKERGVTMAIAIGEWDDNATAEDRTCFGLEAYEAENKILFRFINPEESPWSQTELLGKMIYRGDASNHQLSNEVFAIAELIVNEHPSLKIFLGISNE